MRGKSELKLKLYREALEDYEKYIGIIKDSDIDEKIFFDIGIIKYKLSDYDGAFKYLNKVHNNIKAWILKIISKFRSIFF